MRGIRNEGLPRTFSGVNDVKFYPESVAASTRQTWSSRGLRTSQAPDSRAGFAARAPVLALVCGTNRVSESVRDASSTSGVSAARVAGNWWQAIERRDRTGREKAAPVLELSHVTLGWDPMTNLPTLEGQTYNNKGKEAGSWRSVAVGVVLPDRRIYYQWEGEHDNPNFMNYGGQGTFAFDEMLSGAEGRFWKTDLHKARDGGRASTNDFRLIRCNPDEEETMRGPSKLHWVRSCGG